MSIYQVGSCKVPMKMPQKCTTTNRLKRNKDNNAGLAKSCKDCNLEIYGSKKKTLWLRAH